LQLPAGKSSGRQKSDWLLPSRREAFFFWGKPEITKDQKTMASLANGQWLFRLLYDTQLICIYSLEKYENDIEILVRLPCVSLEALTYPGSEEYGINLTFV
jgi:hypothetical protein